jgi:glycosyltransferase involved in cell wall biosynthesis
VHVAIDLSALMPQPSGVDNYLTELVTHLGSIDAEGRYSLFVNHEDRDLFAGVLPPNFRVHAWCRRPRPVRLLFQQAMLPGACRAIGADVLHSPSFLMPWWRGRSRHLLTVHDATFFSMPEMHSSLRGSAAFRSAVSTSIRRADMINVPSNATRMDLMRFFPNLRPSDIRVTPYGVARSFSPAAEDEILENRRRIGLPPRYILAVGTLEPRKNLERLVESYRRLIQSANIPEHLVIAGQPGWRYERLLELLAHPELDGRVHLRGFVAHQDLPWLYRGARLFAYPSLGEGFGFPPLEAMACGVPVLSAPNSALAETLTGAAELVSPTDITALEDGMRRLLTDEALRSRRREQGIRRAAGYRWEQTARAVRACYRELASSPYPPRTVTRSKKESDERSGGAAVHEHSDHRQAQ